MGYLNTCTFNFDGIGSEQYGLVMGWEGGESDVSTGIEREIIKGDVNMARHKANQYGTTYTSVIPIQFIILHNDGSLFTQAESRMINKWFTADTYKPLHFNTADDTENITYYVICTSIVDKIYNGHNAKELTFECDSPFGYAPKIQYKIKTTNGSGSKKIMNTSDDGYYSPTLLIMTDEDYDGNVEIKNVTDNDSVMVINMQDIPIVDGKKILNINCSLMQITDGNNKIVPAYKLGWEISLNESEPIQSMDKYWLRLVEGMNQIDITGNCELKLTCQFPRKVGVV